MNDPKTPPQADRVLKVVRRLAEPQRKFGEMLIVLEKHCGFLAKDLTEAFEGQEGVQVIVDRRENGFKKPPDERRKPKEELLEVVIFT